MDLFKTAVILAGGKSSRMGFDKQFLSIQNERLMDNIIVNLRKEFEEIIIVSNKVHQYKEKDVKVISDEIKEKGPLSGLHAGLKASSSKYVYLTACDMPFINLDYIRYLKEKIQNLTIDACVTTKEERVEPFHAFYSTSLVDYIEKLFEKECRSLFFLVKSINTYYIEEEITRKFSSDWSMFMNINTTQDIANYLTIEKKKLKA